MADRPEQQIGFHHTQTQKFGNFDKDMANAPKQVLIAVHSALMEKGYNPVNQIVGFLLSGDPTYITSLREARSLICKLERDELLEEIVTFYLDNNLTQ